MGYNYEYEITYTTNDPDDTNFQTDMLKVFNLSSFDTNIINNTMNEIYHLVKDSPEVMKIIHKSNSRWMTDDDEVGLMGLFAFDFFLHFHFILREIYVNNKIIDTNSQHYIKLN
jgi:hypothetical protein